MTEPMNKELLIALCGYYPYGVIVMIEGYGTHKLKGIDNGTISTDRGINYPLRLVKPYLRTIESITEEELNEINNTIYDGVIIEDGTFVFNKDGNWFNPTFPEIVELFKWCNSHFIDYHGLIPDGLALEAKEGMYKTQDL